MRKDVSTDIEKMIQGKVRKDVDMNHLGDVFDDTERIRGDVINAIELLQHSAEEMCPSILESIMQAFPDTDYPMMKTDFLPIYRKYVDVIGDLKDLRDDISSYIADYRAMY